MRYEGYNGQITVEGETLVLTREGMVARAAFGKNTPPRRIPLQAVSGVDFQPATRLKNGWVQLLLGGQTGRALGVGSAGSEGNAVVFTHKHREQFEQLHMWLLTVIQSNASAGIDPSLVEYDEAGGAVGRFDVRAKAMEEWAENQRMESVARKKEQGEASGLRPDIAAAAARLGWKLGGGREIKKLEDHLYEGETVRYMAQGTYEKNQGIVVLTDTRLLFVFHGFTKQTVEDFPLRSISSVQSRSGIVNGDLTVHASGNNAVITGIIKADVTYLANALRQTLASGGALTATAAAPSPPDIADQITQLAELRDRGVLTPEEFDAKKAELLSRM